MKYLILMALVFVTSAFARDVYVDGHVRKDGTYVAPHHRSAPDSSRTNNYGSQGNYNPYTGQQGSIQPQPNYGNSYQKPQPYSHPPTNRGQSGIYGR